MKNKRTILTGAFFIALAIVSMVSVSAFGVSSPYWDGNPMKINIGDTRTVDLNIQNMVGDEDVNVKATLIKGSDITSLEQEVYSVNAQTSNTIVPLTIKMPDDSSPGDVKKVTVEFKSVGEDKQGISMGTGMTISFDVVANGTEEGNSGMILLLVAIIVLVLVLVLLKKRK